MTYKTIKPPSEATKKAKLITAWGKVKDFSFDGNLGSNEFDGQCGMIILYDLSAHEPIVSQIHVLLDSMYQSQLKQPAHMLRSFNPSMGEIAIIITDRVSSRGVWVPGGESERWTETKDMCVEMGTAGPVTRNRNTRNYVRHYTITSKVLMALIKKYL